MNYYGQIEITEISNSAPSGKHTAGFAEITDSNIKFVHYPDCQQLIIWLPAPGMNYDEYVIKNGNGKIIEQEKVADKLNGSIQLLWDTVPFLPGEYSAEFKHKSGGLNIVRFTKHKMGWKPVVEEKIIESAADSTPIVYRDGFGNVIVEEDLLIRKKALEDIENKFCRRIRYEDQGRSGYVIYSDNKNEIRLLYELGGGDCMVYVNIPTEATWEKETGISQADRKEILEYIASVVQMQQASNCYYKINESSIDYYYKK